MPELKGSDYKEKDTILGKFAKMLSEMSSEEVQEEVAQKLASKQRTKRSEGIIKIFEKWIDLGRERGVFYFVRNTQIDAFHE